VIKDELQRQGLLPEFEHGGIKLKLARDLTPSPELDNAQRIKLALKIWNAAVPLRQCATNRGDTLGWRYFTERRGLHIGLLDGLDHALRWHDGFDAIVALMTDARTNEQCGVHRTFLNPDATKRERKMLGKQGVVRLSPDGDVTQGLGIAEGIEDALAVLLSGWAPMWAATSAGAIERFPVLPGVECLTVFPDSDKAGMTAAALCAERWKTAGQEVRIAHPREMP
jgi:hypothetical protein